MRMVRMMVMLPVALLLSLLSAPGHAILPEIVDSGISHILEEDPAPGQKELDRPFVEVQQLPEEPQHQPEEEVEEEEEEDALHQTNDSVTRSVHNETGSENAIEAEHTPVEQETNNITSTAEQSSDLENNIDHGCVTTEDCGKGRYCHYETHKYKCLACKATDVPCTKDEECCGDQLCVWGQCAPNATKGEAGSTCQYQSDCSPDLCCAFHKALLFPICLAKPIERERCFGASNDLMELLSWDLQSPGPRKHCPCAGDLHCQHLGRGSMCLKGTDSSEEDMTDNLYSEIDYII